MTVKQPHVVVLGGSYGGLSLLNSILAAQHDSSADNKDSNTPKVPRVKPRFTLVDERDGFYHTVGAPLGQISPPHAREFWVRYQELMDTKFAHASVDFAQGTVSMLDMASRSLEYQPAGAERAEKLSYDYLVVATGLRRAWPVVPTALNFNHYFQDVQAFETQLAMCKRITVIGGGACGIEMSGELKAHWPDKEIILIHSGASVLNREPLTDEFKAVALQLLQTQGVDVRLNTRLVKDSQTSSGGTKRLLSLSNGESLETDFVIYSAVQQGANSGFLPAEALDDQGCVRVRDTLQFPAGLPHADAHFAIGDVARFSAIKRSVPAMGMGRHVANNILASLVAAEQNQPPQLQDLERPAVPGMTLAVGDYAMSNRKGVAYGKDMKLRAFGTGLGIDGTLEGLGLRPRKHPVL